jgi:hypothetical protein
MALLVTNVLNDIPRCLNKGRIKKYNPPLKNTERSEIGGLLSPSSPLGDAYP